MVSVFSFSNFGCVVKIGDRTIHLIKGITFAQVEGAYISFRGVRQRQALLDFDAHKEVRILRLEIYHQEQYKNKELKKWI
jgi:hypothetical protein